MGNFPLDDPQKREITNQRSLSLRLNLFFFMSFIVFTALIVRLAILQFVEGPELKAKANEMRYRDVPIPPIRGSIFDRDGETIAYSTSTQSLQFTLSKDYSKESNIPELNELILKMKEGFDTYGDPNIPAMTQEDIWNQMDVDSRLNYGFVPRRIKSGLTQAEISYFMQHKTEFPGIEVVEESIRNYSEDTIAVQLIGYLKKYKSAINPEGGLDYYRKIEESNKEKDEKYLPNEDVGFDGIEYMFQNELRGKNGIKTFPVNNANRVIGPMELTKPEKGNNLFLTIHKQVQMKTEDAIMAGIQRINANASSAVGFKPNAHAGYAVAMEVKTGNIVAMASMPDYDPNIWRGGKISNEEYKDIETRYVNGTIRSVSQKYATKEEQNKHPSSIVYLGSVIKPLTVLVGLQENLFTARTKYPDRGMFIYGKAGSEARVRNASSRANGEITASSAIERSSNVFMAEMVGNKLYMRDGMKGVNKWDDYMKEFGLGVVTGSGLLNENAGIIDYFNSAAKDSLQSALVYASFGQQGRYTTLQLAQYATVLANRGIRMKPQFVKEIRDINGKVLKSFQPEVLNKVKFNDSYWNTIEAGMSKVPVDGFEGFPYKYNRKTGTSQQTVSGGAMVENAVFIAYAPADNPVLAVAVVVPEGGYGGRSAAPIARQIFDAYDAEIGLDGVPKQPTKKMAPVTNPNQNTGNKPSNSTNTP
ncbi:cell division protein FtsI [Paenibacillus selenitireducens]|uniref:Cell division protein FtsI n=1 Tax=Paenibacillus selenitireducens TaxID=1324314 RepID=A0A1T2X1U6_9BACL|nr:penicillin-binding transpeptidase domain-containing protein [Paenibacillus selenitireducens]OPA73861.1 cell division protein FtsI [Paenibacillus selenitireducens]